MGCEAWNDHQAALQRLNVQAHANAVSHVEEYVAEAMASTGAINTLITNVLAHEVCVCTCLFFLYVATIRRTTTKGNYRHGWSTSTPCWRIILLFPSTASPHTLFYSTMLQLPTCWKYGIDIGVDMSSGRAQWWSHMAHPIGRRVPSPHHHTTGVPVQWVLYGVADR